MVWAAQDGQPPSHIPSAPEIGNGAPQAPQGMAVAALVLTAVNMFGGFAVTRRMLAMFRK